MVEQRNAAKRSTAQKPPRGEAAPPVRLGLLDELLGYHLRRAQVAVFEDFTATFGTAEVTPGQLGVLAVIDANPGLSQTQLGAALGIDRSTIVGLVDGLEARGLVSRNSAPNDRRSHALKLAPPGAALLRRLEIAVRAHERRVAHALSAAESRQLIALLKRIARPE
jgi:DNA-binding MarR family transcriptional regulator